MTRRTHELDDGLTISVDEQGDGTPLVLLHGGGGFGTVAGLAAALAGSARVLTPSHPGFDGQPRPEWTDTITDLAVAYLDLADRLDLRDVVVIGNSAGGWLAAEMALHDNHQRITGLVLLNAVGIPGDIADADTMSPAEFLRLAWRTPPDVAAMSDEQRATMAANQQALRVYAGDPYCHDPKLPHRLHRVTIPVLVGWGEHDHVVTVDYGREYASMFPNARFELIADAGHLPQVEQAERTLEIIQKFVAGH
jgi:pimeloyl-ACP methyl ester carboxylesterase